MYVDVWFRTCIFVSIHSSNIVESSLTFLRDESPSWSHYSLSRDHSDSLFCVDIAETEIGASGATALVEALKEMRNLEKLNLKSECLLAVMLEWYRGAVEEEVRWLV